MHDQNHSFIPSRRHRVLRTLAVSGHIRGQTNTLPLHIEILYNEYQFAASFAVASLLASLALFTLVLKFIVERRLQQALAQAKNSGVPA